MCFYIQINTRKDNTNLISSRNLMLGSLTCWRHECWILGSGGEKPNPKISFLIRTRFKLILLVALMLIWFSNVEYISYKYEQWVKGHLLQQGLSSWHNVFPWCLNHYIFLWGWGKTDFKHASTKKKKKGKEKENIPQLYSFLPASYTWRARSHHAWKHSGICRIYSSEEEHCSYFSFFLLRITTIDIKM